MTAPPTFVSVPRSRSVAVGRQVSFECEAAGTPAPVVTWKKDQSPVHIRSNLCRLFSFIQRNTISKKISSFWRLGRVNRQYWGEVVKQLRQFVVEVANNIGAKNKTPQPSSGIDDERGTN